MKLRRVAYAAAASALIVAGVFSAGAPATAVTGPSNACGSLIELAKSSPDYKAVTSNAPSSGDFFSCSGSIATVEPTRDGKSLGKIGVDSRTKQTANMTGLTPQEREKKWASIGPHQQKSEDPAARPAAPVLVPPPAPNEPTKLAPTQHTTPAQAAPDANGGVFTSFYRTINTPYRETTGWLVEFGYNGDDPNIQKFDTEIKNTAIFSLGAMSYFTIIYNWTELDDRLVAPDLFFDLYKMEGILPSDFIGDTTVLGSDDDENYVYRTSNSETGTHSGLEGGNTYSSGFGTGRIYDLASNHAFDFDSYVGYTHRWACPVGATCWWPNGEEAPVFG